MGKYFGTDGIRGKAEMFTWDFLEKIVVGLGVSGKRVMIGGDTRESTKKILENLESLLSNNGASEVGNVGVFPTPGINYVFYYLGYDYAIDVTASHNPYTDNGIKIFERGESSGIKLSSAAREKIERQLIDDSPLALAEMVDTRTFEDHDRALKYYVEHLLTYVDGVDLSGLRVAMDCANGATGIISGQAFESLGAEVTVINNDTTFGKRINDGVGSTHIEEIQEFAKTGEFDFGVAFDGDGDRCMLVDETGNVVDGDQILAILAKYLGLSALVATVMANQGLLNWGAANDIEVVTADVGDQNVAVEMRTRGIKLGGEQSGHIILPNEAMGDGMLTTLVIAKVMRQNSKKLSELASDMQKTPQVLLNIPAEQAEKAMLAATEVQDLISEYGKKLEDVHGRVLVRPSGTESLIRITMWGDDQNTIELLAHELAEKLTEKFKNGRN